MSKPTIPIARNGISAWSFLSAGELRIPRYYFQLIDQGKVYHDSEGADCPDDEAARHEAAITLSEVAKEVLAADGLLHEFEMIVFNDQGGTVWRTSLEFEATAGEAHGS